MGCTSTVNLKAMVLVGSSRLQFSTVQAYSNWPYYSKVPCETRLQICLNAKRLKRIQCTSKFDFALSFGS